VSKPTVTVLEPNALMRAGNAALLNEAPRRSLLPWTLAVVNLPTFLGIGLGLVTGHELVAFGVGAALAILMAVFLKRAGANLLQTIFYAGLLPVLAIAGWGEAEALLTVPEPITLEDLSGSDTKVVELEDGELRTDLMGHHRKEGISDRPDSHSYVVPIAADAWSDGDPIAAWAVCRMDLDSQDQETKCRAIFEGERRIGKRRPDPSFRKAIRAAEKRHGLQSAKNAVLLDWDWDPGGLVNVLILGTIALVLGNILFPLGSLAQRANALEAAPMLARRLSPNIASAPRGMPIKVRGQMHGSGATIAAPMTGRPCLAWTLVVTSRHLGLLFKEAGIAPHVLRDSSGQAIVDTQGACLITLPYSASETSGDRQLDALEAFLVGRGMEPRLASTLGQSLTWEEGVLVEGDAVIVGGTLQDQSQGAVLSTPPHGVLEVTNFESAASR